MHAPLLKMGCMHGPTESTTTYPGEGCTLNWDAPAQHPTEERGTGPIRKLGCPSPTTTSEERGADPIRKLGCTAQHQQPTTYRGERCMLRS